MCSQILPNAWNKNRLLEQRQSYGNNLSRSVVLIKVVGLLADYLANHLSVQPSFPLRYCDNWFFLLFSSKYTPPRLVWLFAHVFSLTIDMLIILYLLNSSCFSDTSGWMMERHRQLSLSKTQLVVIPASPSVLNNISIQLSVAVLSLSKSARNLGILSDAQLSPNCCICHSTLHHITLETSGLIWLNLLFYSFSWQGCQHEQ